MISSIDRWHNDIKVLNLNIPPLPPNPKDIDEALSGTDSDLWLESIKKEIDAFTSRNLWGTAEQHGRAMKTKLLFSYNIQTRLVVCGYKQKKGIDYIDTYSPTTTTAIVFFLLHISSVYRWHRATFDVSSAYLEGDADVKLYAWLTAAIIE